MKIEFHQPRDSNIKTYTVNEIRLRQGMYRALQNGIPYHGVLWLSNGSNVIGFTPENSLATLSPTATCRFIEVHESVTISNWIEG